MRPENLLKIANALGVSTDYLLTGNIVDKDLLLLSEKLSKLTPSQLDSFDLELAKRIKNKENHGKSR